MKGQFGDFWFACFRTQPSQEETKDSNKSNELEKVPMAAYEGALTSEATVDQEHFLYLSDKVSNPKRKKKSGVNQSRIRGTGV